MTKRKTTASPALPADTKAIRDNLFRAQASLVALAWDVYDAADLGLARVTPTARIALKALRDVHEQLDIFLPELAAYVDSLAEQTKRPGLRNKGSPGSQS